MSVHPDIAIVVIAYNRPLSLERLLSSLQDVDFEGISVPLIISIDYSEKDSVYDIAAAYEWPYGEKRIIKHDKNLGLRNHVLFCGDLVSDYDAIVVLEDDLVVSPAMFSYTWRAVEYYNNNDSIAAISLYAKRFNETAMKPFEPANYGDDTYFVQTAESWGQVWMKRQWMMFREWYKENAEPFTDAENIPLNVCRWGENSWKKYHIKYCIECNKWTVYPYVALSTCMGDAGEHFENSTSLWQVPLLFGTKHEYKFADLNEKNAVKYDAYLERCYKEDICMDLYGKKQNYGSFMFVITSKHLPYEAVESYGLSMRPHEMNIYHTVPGDRFFKYRLDSSRPDNSCCANDDILYYHFVDPDTVIRKAKISELINELRRRIRKRFRLRIK